MCFIVSSVIFSSLKNCISPVICLNTHSIFEDHMIFFSDMVVKHYKLNTWVTRSTVALILGPMCTSHRYMTKPQGPE